ncbi:hypothetical protein R4B61_03400 [Fructilactobacillus vespulae]|uniref:hypothetical protein n=1 Tax=Fructilactobacillus vespulae TaxID=1249630 RepID=UPI0039B6879F
MLETIINSIIVVIATVAMIYSFKPPYDKETFLKSNNENFVLLFLGIILTICLAKVFILISLVAGISLLIKYKTKD